MASHLLWNVFKPYSNELDPLILISWTRGLEWANRWENFLIRNSIKTILTQTECGIVKKVSKIIIETHVTSTMYCACNEIVINGH